MGVIFLVAGGKTALGTAFVRFAVVFGVATAARTASAIEFVDRERLAPAFFEFDDDALREEFERDDFSASAGRSDRFSDRGGRVLQLVVEIVFVTKTTL